MSGEGRIAPAVTLFERVDLGARGEGARGARSPRSAGIVGQGAGQHDIDGSPSVLSGWLLCHTSAPTQPAPVTGGQCGHAAVWPSP